MYLSKWSLTLHSCAHKVGTYIIRHVRTLFFGRENFIVNNLLCEIFAFSCRITDNRS